MAFYNRAEMVYKDYSWTATANDNPNNTGSPDNDLLNRKEGYEMLNFINTLMIRWDLKDKTSGQRIEKMIREKVPHSLHSQRHVTDWIVLNWN